jgi:hypothetical protein
MNVYLLQHYIKSQNFNDRLHWCYHHTLDFSLRMYNTCPSAILYQLIIYFFLKYIN